MFLHYNKYNTMAAPPGGIPNKSQKTVTYDEKKKRRITAVYDLRSFLGERNSVTDAEFTALGKKTKSPEKVPKKVKVFAFLYNNPSLFKNLLFWC